MRPKYEVADVIRLLNKELNPNNFSFQQLKVLHALSVCRTAHLGGHVMECDSCKHNAIAYNSCRNRHCPKCQGMQREAWINRIHEQLLNVPYYHVVFTLPNKLNGLCLAYPKVMYDLLFKASWKTIKTFAKNNLRVKTGMTAVLHTWGQNMSLHPHLHCIVPGGGVSEAGNFKQSDQNGKYLFSVKAMAKVYRSVFLKKLKRLIKSKTVKCDEFDQIEKILENKKWVVYAKKPFAGPWAVVEYVGRYTHKVAISNHRIRSIDEKYTQFNYMDYRDSKHKTLKIKHKDFIQRFALHIMPKGFVRIRHFGLHTPYYKQTNLNLKVKLGPISIPTKPEAYKSLKQSPTCPSCKKTMHKTYEIPPIRGKPRYDKISC